MFSKIKLGAAGVAVAALSLMGAQAASASPASSHVKPAATAACNFECFNLSSLLTGPDAIQNAYIPNGNGVAITAKAGDKLNLKLGDDSYTQEDFTNDVPGYTVSDFCAPVGFPVEGQEWPANSYICKNYSGDTVYEVAFSPDGNESNLCVGVTSNVAGQNVRLEPCGVSVDTLWVADTANAHLGATPWASGADSGFSHPLVLTVNSGSKSPQNQLYVQQENLLTGSYVDNDQEFRVTVGPFV